MSEAGEPAKPVLSYRAFAMFFAGRIVSILSFQMLVVAIGWQLYSLTGSAFDLGLLGLAQFVPMIALTLVVGHVVDRYDHRLILLGCQLAEAAAAAILAVGSMMGWLDPIAMYAVMVLAGSARAFEIPTMVAIIPALVPRSIVPQATAYFATANQAGSVIGPLLGGYLYGQFGLGPVTVYGAAIALWCVGAFFIFLMHMEPVHPRGRRDQPALRARRLLPRVEGQGDLRHHLARHVRGVPRRARARCFRCSPATSCRPVRGAWDCSAPGPASAPLSCRSFSPVGR